MNDKDHHTTRKGRRLFGLDSNVVWMGVVSFFNDLSSDMIFPFIPIFLTSVLGASLTFVGLIEGLADATASILKIASGRLSDKWQKRKSLSVIGYSLSAISKPMLAMTSMPWHVLAVRFTDRVGKGVRDAPRDALISLSTERRLFGRAFGFHRAMDTLGAAIGPLLAFAILPLISNNYRVLFLLSFIASFFAVLVLIFFVREVGSGVNSISADTLSAGRESPAATVRVERPIVTDITEPRGPVHKPEGEERRYAKSWRKLGMPFFLFLAVATIASLGKSSEAFLILKAREVGVALVLLPILYFVFNTTAAILAAPFGALADRVGKRITFTVGLLMFAAVYLGFAFAATPKSVWFLFAAYGLYAALTEGVGRAIVAGLVQPEVRATAFGIYSASTGLALLPASVVFGFIGERFGSHIAFGYGAILALAAAFGFLIFRKKFSSGSDRQQAFDILNDSM